MLKPEVDPDIADNILGLERYQMKNYNVYAHYVFNTMNRCFIHEGLYFKAKLSQSVHNDGEIVLSDEAVEDLSGSFGSLTELSLDFEKRYPLRKKMTAVVGATTGFTFYDDARAGEDDLSYTIYGYGSKYYLGGVLTRPRKDNATLPGLNEAELPVTQFMMLYLSLHTTGKFTLSPMLTSLRLAFRTLVTMLMTLLHPMEAGMKP
ncbi:MAG: hypothetical protein U5K51_06620 [Flavobacteriaceae bacterium]|nr:hypothetical protein [Flavobacteriaceae bacterium]